MFTYSYLKIIALKYLASFNLRHITSVAERSLPSTYKRPKTQNELDGLPCLISKYDLFDNSKNENMMNIVCAPSLNHVDYFHHGLSKKLKIAVNPPAIFNRKIPAVLLNKKCWQHFLRNMLAY